MKRAAIKTVVWMLIIVELWLLLQVPALGDALFGFIIGGEVPGSSRVLSPQEMMLFLAGVFVAAVSLIFRKEINRVFQLIRGSRRQAEPAIAAPVKAAPAKHEPVAVVRHTKTAKPRTPLFMPRLRQVGRVSLRFARRAVKISLHWSGIAASFMQKHAARAARVSARLLRAGWTVLAARSVQFWKWLRPRLEQFDRWLNRRLHQNEQSANLLAVAREAAVTLRGWFAYLRAMKEKFLSDGK